MRVASAYPRRYRALEDNSATDAPKGCAEPTFGVGAMSRLRSTPPVSGIPALVTNDEYPNFDDRSIFRRRAAQRPSGQCGDATVPHRLVLSSNRRLPLRLCNASHAENRYRSLSDFGALTAARVSGRCTWSRGTRASSCRAARPNG